MWVYHTEVRPVVIKTWANAWDEVHWETPSGTINWVNLNFVLSNTPIAWTECVLLNWMRLKYTLDYTISSNILVFVTAPISWDIIQVDYNF